MANYGQKYEQIFDYLSAPDTPVSPEDAVVFGRKDPLVAYALGDLIMPGLVETAVITGGIGKDSGDILEQGFKSEAAYLHTQLQEDASRRNYQLPKITLEETAANGGENARNSLTILDEGEGAPSTITAVAHATSLRRLGETLKFEAEKRGVAPTTVHRVPSKYVFDPTNPIDRDEAAAELLRIADWPAKGFLGPQKDIPENLVDFVRDVHGRVPKPVAPWQSAILRRLSPRIQQHVINLTTKHSQK